MCGIFGILSSPRLEASPSVVDEATARITRLAALDGERLRGDPAAMEGAQKTLAAALEGSFRLVRRSGFLPVLRTESLRRQIDEGLARMREWVRGLEAQTERGGFHGQKETERFNQLIVGGRDLVWRLERDVLANLAAVRRLLADREDLPPDASAHAWQLNLILNNLDRLEVRGRDSAGLAVYARFPSAAAVDGFLAARPLLGADLQERSRRRSFTQGAVVRPRAGTLLFAFKVAEEVGEMGSNARFLREAIRADRLFQAVLSEPGVEIQALAHTRWASNGIVSLPNCHPVDSAISGPDGPLEGSPGALVAVLNGDVDNYQELREKYIHGLGLAIDPEITTDAKIIPVVVGHHLRRTGSLEEAFRLAFDEFEGSMAIGVMAADRPGELLVAQKGSGQGLFLGFAGQSVVVASEMYGLVEATQDSVKAEGERIPGGEVFRIARAGDGVAVRLLDRQGDRSLPRDRVKRAEITTRDINRGEFPRFLLKEITESVESVRKTLRGRFEVGADGAPRFHLGAEVLDPARVEGLRSGAVRRIIGIGQGTAAIAAEGIVFLLRRALAGARPPLEIWATKATELSGHGLRDDMSDTLVVAVSQSGTTTDTNRTVDLLKDRGAWVIAIVNRRSSDLVYKSHGVLYTSDGRDIEMSVASTKAFYAQNVAGQVLALALAEALGALPPRDLGREAKALLDLPAAMEKTLALGPWVKELAERHALRKPYWAVVGSGAGKIAADEVRIKLSELCYKSIATDYLEDKKHIDLSSEPLVLVAATGASPSTISDCVKEVAIFKAHRSVPLVIAEEGETRFDPYAAGVISVPRHEGALSYLLATMVGHLFGYHAAAAFDRQAGLLRAIRAGVIREFARDPAEPETGEEALDEGGLPAPSDGLVAEIARFEDLLQDGALDSGLRTGMAVRLSAVFQYLLGRITLDLFVRHLRVPAERRALVEAMVLALTRAIDELSRPIDAIKHQAKTVTVGISRLEEPKSEGALWKLLRELDLPVHDLAESHRAFLSAFEPLVARVEGATVYHVAGLDAVGRPRTGSTIRTLRRTGAAGEIPTRSAQERLLSGTKWGVVRSREIYLGYGQTDGRRILILPLVGEKAEGSLVLFHIDLAAGGERSVRLRALAAHRTHLERLKIAVTERNQVWDAALIDRLDNERLFLGPPEQVAQELCTRPSVAYLRGLSQLEGM